jgi:uncharacterized membrane protein YvbJ
MMGFCTECSQQQDDDQKFCRFCGERLPGAMLMRQLREEQANIQAQKTGQVSQTQQANLATLQAIELARQQQGNEQGN